MLNIVGRRYWYFGLSLLVMIPGLLALGFWGLPLAIDFTGGSKLEVSIAQATDLSTSRVGALLDEAAFRDNVVQLSSGNVVIIRTKSMDDASKSDVIAALETEFGAPVELLSFENVGPVIGREVGGRAVQAVGIAALGILAYITYAFRGVEHSFRYGVCAILALLHDATVVIGVAAILGRLLGWEVDALFLTALLTVIGFSVHDSIVVFDRIRENLGRYRRADYEEVVNLSIVQTLDRSINTQLTALFTLLALALFGGATIFHFVVTMMIGILSGTYSSIFNAAPILVVWQNREWRRWFRRTAVST
ncbi:MAG: protein translocase subunit SecF [Anaerolineales bacterium]|jgi:preprotein translocase subunit SecF|nr:protein translocase subunit SecF [Anaerolineales bacterium]